MKKISLILLALIIGCLISNDVKSHNGAIRQPQFKLADGSPIAVGPMAGEPALGDANGDGNLDIFLACGTCCGSQPSPLSGHVMVLLGDGRGQFKPAKSSPIKVAPSARKLALGDVNRDGKLDILVAQHDSYAITILLGDGKGDYQPAKDSPALAGNGPRSHTHDIVVADVNRDGNLDALTTNANDNTVSVLLGDGTGRFSPSAGSPVSAGRHPYDVVTLNDVNGDGLLDLITPNLRANTVTVMLGDGKGGFTAANGSPFALGPRPGYVSVADLNDDGRLDIVATHDDDPLVALLLGDGKGGFAPALGSPLQTDKAVWGSAVTDVNGDGKSDLVLASGSGHHVAILLGDGQGGFTPAACSPLAAGKLTNYVAAGDLNKDGKADIVASNYASGDVTVYLNTTK